LLVPAAIDERQAGTDLVAADAASINALLLDMGFTGRRFAGQRRDRQGLHRGHRLGPVDAINVEGVAVP
jgi:hypothetical protein